MEEVKKPWFKFYGCVPETLDYPDCTMAEAVENVAKKYPDYIAYDFMGKKTTYANAVKDIIAAAKALKALGVKEEDRVTICMPNTPQTVSMFYAANMVGAIANMIHPLMYCSGRCSRCAAFLNLSCAFAINAALSPTNLSTSLSLINSFAETYMLPSLRILKFMFFTILRSSVYINSLPCAKTVLMSMFLMLKSPP